LEEVPGIGEAYAKKIIAGRPYKSVDDLAKEEIPEATITKIRPLVVVEEPTPINVNKATEAQLEEVPGIGEAYTKNVSAGRPNKSINAHTKAGGPAATIEKIRSLVSTTDVARHTVAKPVVPTAPKIPDLNQATEAQLEQVPGIGEAYAKKIIAG